MIHLRKDPELLN